MPTISVNRAELFKRLGKTYTDQEFDELCFEFGIELDEVTSEREMKRKEVGGDKVGEDMSEEIIYRIDVPANRYDLLCIEGLSRGLLTFLGVQKPPRHVAVRGASTHEIRVKSSCAAVRPYVVAAILRNMTFTPASYASFIDLQDKLHQNICRKRTLVAIGTHDLDTIQGPFVYEARKPEDIRFVPLNRTNEMNGRELMEHLSTDLQLKRYLPIIRDSPVYPVITDAKGVVLSLPPIINGDHSKIRLTTKNVLIECTATDLTKASIVLNTMLTMFGEYCQRPFEAEIVRVVYENEPNKPREYPDFTYHQFETTSAYINGAVGVKLEDKRIAELLERMCLEAKAVGGGKITVKVPPTRSDILHACDIMEDVAIAYGYNNLSASPAPTNTVGAQQPLNLLSDLVRRELAQAGYSEFLNFALCSHAENFEHLRLVDDGRTAVTLANPKTIEFQVVRTSLLPGLFKSLSNNKDMPLPMRVFEVSDVVLRDEKKDVGAINRRRLAAVYCDNVAAFEAVHGLLDHMMAMLRVKEDAKEGYKIVQDDSIPTYLQGRGAAIMFRGNKIGSLGVVHPEVLKAFELVNPCTAIEFDLEPFL